MKLYLIGSKYDCQRLFLNMSLYRRCPTYQQVEQPYDTIIAQAAGAILGKLHFYVVISSTIDPKLKRLPIRIAERSLRYLTIAEKR